MASLHGRMEGAMKDSTDETTSMEPVSSRGLTGRCIMANGIVGSSMASGLCTYQMERLVRVAGRTENGRNG
jgi:hypothetical protein